MESGDDLDEALARARAGDENGFLMLWTDLNPRLLRYLRVLGCDDADDIASETWLQAVRDLQRFHGGKSDEFRAWLFTIARHRAIDSGRSRARRRALPARLGTTYLQQVAPDTADVVLERLSTHAVLTAIASLPADQAEIIMLRVVAGLDAPAVALIVGKSPGAVRVAAHRGLRRLATVLDQSGVTV